MNFPVVDLRSNECKLDFWNSWGEKKRTEKDGKYKQYVKNKYSVVFEFKEIIFFYGKFEMLQNKIGCLNKNL